jgi:hypothetical protein
MFTNSSPYQIETQNKELKKFKFNKTVAKDMLKMYEDLDSDLMTSKAGEKFKSTFRSYMLRRFKHVAMPTVLDYCRSFTDEQLKEYEKLTRSLIKW